ncbi:MAG TPA: HYR domain-containing protein [Anaerolineales bacterium]|nr:HYR domain-containing protein [Anaerolineales bacterium]
MQRKNRLLNSFLSVILILSLTLMNVNVALADDGVTPEPAVTAEPTEEPAQPTSEPTEPPVVATETPVVDAPVPTEAASTEQPPVAEEQAPIAELLTQAPENTDLVVLDENGEALPLTSQEALNTILETDPMWCPAGVLPGGAGCTTNFADVSALIADMVNNTGNYTQNGIIYFTSTSTQSLSFTTSTLTGGDFNTLNSFNLTLQGGWNGSNGDSATFTGQTSFGSNTITIGTVANPWIGNITLNNFTFSGVSSSNAITVYTTTGNITLDNVDVADQTNNTFTSLLNSTSGNITVQNGSTFDGDLSNQSRGFSATTTSGSITISDTAFSESLRNGNPAYNGATLSAPTVTLNNVIATGSDGDGIAINNVNLVTLNNVTASNNGTENGQPGFNGNNGSGIFVNGTSGSRVIIVGGTFTGNQLYGLEVGSPANTTIYIQSNPICTGNDSNALATPTCYNDTTIFDNTAPVINPTISGTAGSNGWYTSNVGVTWSVTDAESGIASSNGCSATNLTSETTGVTLTCSASNNAGLSNSVSVTIKIDKTNPVISFVSRLPAANANGWNNSDVTVNWSCSDGFSGVVSASISQTVSTEGANQSTTGTCQDLAGNSASNTQSGINIDKTIPVLNLPSNMTVEATSNAGAVANYSASTSDNLDPAPVLSCVPASGSTFAIGTTMVNCTATDQADNTAFGNFNITVQDRTAPIIDAHLDITEEATSSLGATVTYISPATSDAVDGPGVASCSPSSGENFALGDTTVTCTAIDTHGNAATPTTFVIHVVDTTAPVIDPHGDVTAEATSAAGANVSYSNPVTSDIVDGTGEATCSPASGDLFPLGDTLVTCNATDQHGNTAIPTSFMVHVVDTTAPVIAPHADVFVAATSPAGAIVNYTSPATSDVVDGADVATCTPASGTQFPIGNTTVNCTATDSHGNDAVPTSFVVHVIDTDAPVIDGHLDVTVEATSAAGAVATYTSPGTTDAIDGPGVATCSPSSGTFFAFGNTTVTCNATDSNGNMATPTSFVVHVVDTTAPVIASHADVTVITSNSIGAIVSFTSPATSDAVDGAGMATCSPASGSFFVVGDTLVTCNATDAHSNAAQPVTFKVHVVYQPGAPTPGPTPAPSNETQEDSLSIPVTSGLLDLDCLSVIESDGIKVTFHNLCDYQALVADAPADTLPAQLPDQYSFVQGLNVLVFFEQEVIKALPTGTGVQLDFPIPANTQNQYAMLLWDDEDGDGMGEWLDVTQLVADKDLSKVMSADASDELYQITPTKTLEAFYRVLTTEKTGTFVLVKK